MLLRIGTGVLVLMLGASLAGCAASRGTRSDPKPSGFLGDYSMMQPGESDQAKLLYVAPDVDFARYDAIEIDSVTLWSAGDLVKLSKEDQKRLADLAFQSIHDALAKDYRIVEEPGPNVLRLRAAITDAHASVVALDVLATAIPQINLLSGAAGLAADTSLTVGRASAELELTDSMTGRRLVAAVDERVGARSLSGVTDKWSDVGDALARWSERLRVRLASLRGAAPAS